MRFKTYSVRPAIQDINGISVSGNFNYVLTGAATKKYSHWGGFGLPYTHAIAAPTLSEFEFSKGNEYYFTVHMACMMRSISNANEKNGGALNVDFENYSYPVSLVDRFKSISSLTTTEYYASNGNYKINGDTIKVWRRKYV